MNPIYNPALRATLQPADVAEYVKRYGPPTVRPTPGPGLEELVIRVRSGVPSIDGYLVSKRP